MFQSTHSLRSATLASFGLKLFHMVSIHALLAECDLTTSRVCTRKESFQSTHSLRSATRARYHVDSDYRVSIHALLAECDAVAGAPKVQRRCFNPRTPCGVRRLARRNGGCAIGFNPRTPCGVRQSWTFKDNQVAKFQSTHSLRSATDAILPVLPALTGFNPRTPCGVRHGQQNHVNTGKRFQSTHSLRSATPVYGGGKVVHVVSIHALLAECDLPYGQR